MYGLSKLSVWWLRLGIAIERIQPGDPQQNGRHERMHLTLKKERPHQALEIQVPAALYRRPPRVYRGLEELTYPFPMPR